VTVRLSVPLDFRFSFPRGFALPSNFVSDRFVHWFYSFLGFVDDDDESVVSIG